MAKAQIIRKLQAYKKNPNLIKEVSNTELADLVLIVMRAVETIDQSIKEGRLDGFTPQPDKDYLAKNTALSFLTSEVNKIVAKTDKVLGETSTELEKRVQEAIQNIRNGNDGIVTEEEIQRAAEMALGMLELPDFDALVTEAITSNSEAIRNSLELLSGEDRYKVEIADVQGLQKMIDDLSIIRSSGGGLGKRQVFDFIREAIANGIITSGGASTLGGLTDVTVSATDPETADGTFWVDIS